MTTTLTAKPITIPPKAVINPLDQQCATVALTRREVEQLLTASGYGPFEVLDAFTGWDSGCPNTGAATVSTGAKVSPGAWRPGHRPPTRARTFLLYGYHYAGTDVAALVEVAA